MMVECIWLVLRELLRTKKVFLLVKESEHGLLINNNNVFTSVKNLCLREISKGHIIQ